MVIVLDNANSAGQLRSLIPANPDCTVLVTSRDNLTGLVAREGAARVHLDVLSETHAIALLRRLIGERATGEVESMGDLAARCGRLPLALRLAAELAASQPLKTIGDIVADLDQPLDALDAVEDTGASIRQVFASSYRQLAPEVARALRLLAVVPGADITLRHAAALFEAEERNASRLLRHLVRVNLVDERQPGRFCLHDLVGP